MEIVPTTLADSRPWNYFPTLNKSDVHLFGSAFGDLLESYAAKLYKHLKEVYAMRDKQIWVCWFHALFLGFFPVELVYRILDAFLHEGYKVLYRYALAALILSKQQIMALKTPEAIDNLFRPDRFRLNFDELARTAYGYFIRRKTVQQNKKRRRRLGLISDSTAALRAEDVYQRQLPVINGDSGLLSPDQWSQLWAWIPTRTTSYGSPACL